MKNRQAAPSLSEIDQVFEAISHEARRQIVLMLSHSGDELPSGYLAARFAHSWPTTTRHLSVLEAAGLIHVRREGRSAFYRLDRSRLRRVVGGWLDFVTPVDPKKTWAAKGPRTTHELKGT